MKQKNLLTKLFLLCALIVGSSSAMWADDTYVKVASTADLVADGEYILAETSTDTKYLANTTYSSSKYGTITSGFTINGNQITVPSTTTTVLVLKLGIVSDGVYTLRDIKWNTNGWLGKASSNTNFARSSSTSVPTSDNAYYWSIKSETAGYVLYSNYKSSTKDHTNRFIGRNSSTTGPYSDNNYPMFVLYKKIVAPTFTITAQSNDTDMGTVSLLGSTITATPANGYRVSTSNPYTVSPANAATVSQNGNVFTVTPTAACTVAINFEEIPSHTLTSELSVTGAGVITLGETSLKEGSSTSISVTSNAGYKFTGWSVSGAGASVDNSESATATFTMGTEDATVTANFAAITTYAISWNLNGTTIRTDNIEENTSITFNAPVGDIPVGYTFIGWSSSEVLTPQNVVPNTMVTSAKSTADITYYAVLAVQDGMTTASLTKMTSTDTFADGDKVVIVATDDNENQYALYQEIVNKSYLNKYSFVNNVETIASDDKNWITVHSSDTNWILGDATNGYLKNSSNELYLDTDIDKAVSFTLAYTADKGFSLKVSKRWLAYRSDLSSNLYFRMGGEGTDPSGVGYFDIYKYVSSEPTYFGYCTTISNVVIKPAKEYVSYSNNVALDFTNVDGLKAFVVSNETDDNVTLSRVYKVPANTGLVLKKTGEATSYDVPVLTGDADEFTNKLLPTGTDGVTVTASSVYVLSNGTFKLYTGTSIVGGKAYLPQTSNAATLSLDFGDETTSMSLTPTLSEGKGVWYDLSGRKLNSMPTAKGIYIMNGKKVIIK